MTLDTLVSPATPTAPGHLAPQFLLRFNHVGATFLPAFPHRAALQAHLEQLPVLAAGKEAALQALYEWIPGLQEDERRTVVAYRRDLFNGRVPRTLPPDLAARLPGAVTAHLQADETSDRQRRTLLAALDDHLGVERAALQQVCRDERFLAAVAVSSGALYDAARQYAGTPLAEQRGSLRKSEHRLLQFAARAAWKTSPFSSYTSVGGGRWRPGGSRQVGRPDIQATVTVHHVPVLRLIDLALRTPELRASLAYSPGPGLRLHGSELQFEQAHDDPVRQPRARNLASRRVTYRLNGGLARVLRLTQRGPTAYGELLAALVGQGDGPDTETARRFLDRLIDDGLLRPDTGLREQAPDLLGQAARLLDRAGTPAADTAATALRGLARTLEHFPASPAARPAALAAARAQLDTAYGAFGAAAPAGPVLYEDTAAPELLELDPAPFALAFESLHTLIGVLRVFDTHLLFGPLLRARLLAVAGPGARIDDLPTFVRDHADLFDAWLQASVSGLPAELQHDPDLQAIVAVQREVRGAYLQAARRGDEELVFTPAQLQAWHAALPRRLTERPWSYGAFVQVETGAAPVLHVNQIYAGSGQYFSRFLTQLPPALHEDIRAGLPDLAPPGTRLVGLRSAHGFNANLHPPYTDTELQVDEPVDGPQLSVEDLYLEHDLALDEVVLRHKGSGDRVQVIYAGFLIAQLLPTLKNFLVTLTNTGLIVPHLPDIADVGLAAGRGGDVRRTPRLRAGQVVLHRARWVVPRSALPLPADGTADAAYLLTVQQWRAAHGLPDRVFVRLRRPARAAASEGAGLQAWQSELAGGTQKPQLLDFCSPLHLRWLVKLARDTDGDFVFEECTPLPGQFLLQDGQTPLVSELLIELQHTGGPR